ERLRLEEVRTHTNRGGPTRTAQPLAGMIPQATAAIARRHPLPHDNHRQWGGVVARRGRCRGTAKDLTVAQTASRRRAYVGLPITWAVAACCTASTTPVRETSCFRAATFFCRASKRAFWTIGVMSLWYCARSSTVFSPKPRALMFAASAGAASICALT